MATDDFEIYFARAAALYQLSMTGETVEDKSVLKQSTCCVSPAKFKSNPTPSTLLQRLPSETASPLTSSPGGVSSEPAAAAATALSSTVNGQQRAGRLRPPRRSVSCKYPAGNRRRLSPRSCLQSGTDDELALPVEIAAVDLTTSSRSCGVGPANIVDSGTAGEGTHRTNGAGLCHGRIGTATVGCPSSAAGSAAAGGVPRACNSAPHSRSSSWRKARRPKDSMSQWNQNGTTNGVSLESEVIEKLQQLKLMQEDNYYVVRSFRTTPSRGIVSRGDDQFRRLNVSGDDSTNGLQATPTSSPYHGSLQTAGELFAIRKQQQLTEVAVNGIRNVATSQQTTEIHKVVVVGLANVGKTALLQQFMTSHYMAAVCTSFDDEFAKTVTVVLDDDEVMTLDFVDIGTWRLPTPSRAEPQLQDHELEPIERPIRSSPRTVCDADRPYQDVGRADAYLVVYSMTDPASFRYAVEVTCELRRRRLPVSSTTTSTNDTSIFDSSQLVNDRHCHTTVTVPTSASRSPVIIMVANKSDLVRTRQVSKSDATCFCNLLNTKYIEVSASLNHRVDELLVGIVRQIRRRQQLRHPSTIASDPVGLRRKRSARRRSSSTSSASGNADVMRPCGGEGDPGDSACNSGGSWNSPGGRGVSVSCPDGATVGLCSVRAVKELFKEIFAGSDAVACIQIASDTDCENLLEL